MSIRPSHGLAVGSLLAILPVATSYAQKVTAAITGRVVTSADGTPVAGAQIFLAASRKRIKTDSVGRFAFEALRPGTHQVEASIIGFAPLVAVVVLAEGERKDIEFRTDTVGAFLPTIYVEGESQPELIKILTKFERRMAFGSGRYITRADIVKRNPMRLLDLLRFLPGVRVSCVEFRCEIRLNQDPRGCPPAVFMDDVQTTQHILDATLPTDLEGIEIYRGPSETPPELNNETARCGGAIAMWTRRGRSP